MALRLLGHIELPADRSSGGFDHADIHAPTDRLYVAHTSNDAIDVIDIAKDEYFESIPACRRWPAFSCPKRVDSSLPPIEVRTPSPCLHRVPSVTLSRSGWA